MKRLVVTADDVGLHSAMTEGALRAHDQGIVTAVSLAPVGADFATAAAAVAARPKLDPGIHLTFVGGGRPLSPASEVRTLLDRYGLFVSGFRTFTARWLRGALDLRELERELRRQIEVVLAAGLRPLHLNSHQHVHVLPGVFEIVLRLALEYEIHFVRIPGEPRPGWAGPRAMEMRVLNAFARGARRKLAAARNIDGLPTIGVLRAGRLSLGALAKALAAAEGRSELVCHPGTDNDELDVTYAWGYDWEAETEALCSAAAREMLAAAGVERCGFRDLR